MKTLHISKTNSDCFKFYRPHNIYVPVTILTDMMKKYSILLWHCGCYESVCIQLPEELVSIFLLAFNIQCVRISKNCDCKMNKYYAADGANVLTELDIDNGLW